MLTQYQFIEKLPKMTQAQAAVEYAKFLQSGLHLNWEKINWAMIARWSKSGMIRVKRNAWRIVND